jgi:hypothetical protein
VVSLKQLLGYKTILAIRVVVPPVPELRAVPLTAVTSLCLQVDRTYCVHTDH